MEPFISYVFGIFIFVSVCKRLRFSLLVSSKLSGNRVFSVFLKHSEKFVLNIGCFSLKTQHSNKKKLVETEGILKGS